MPKVKFNSVRFSKELRRKFEGFSSDKKEMDRVASVVLRNIKADTRDGKGFDGKALPSISSATIARRKALSAVNNTSRFFTPGKSNATFMGDTVNKIKGNFVGKGRIELFGDGKHRKMTGVRGKKLKGSDASISDILAGLKSLGYKLLGMSDKSRDSIKKQFRRYIRRRLK